MKLKNLLGLAMLGVHRVMSEYFVTLKDNRLMVGDRAVADVLFQPTAPDPATSSMIVVPLRRGYILSAKTPRDRSHVMSAMPAVEFNLAQDAEKLMEHLKLVARARV